ncbi:5'-nucleotidase, lipoprotein e(P4) family [Photobacterium kishitanii]|uniref:5'-nucleotidase, lipoprotein e(P4) family n=1 Tax=Photobacterium kishitanii TaxID=318456 RepID=UPI000D170854|nr:5'-nucleotidase, lipoprotein e(P4) family [Photobacterium kishitanii]PSV18641.1 5'-nucleotidase, lipoprotein e(P4) family [Photobacterium kishitanii]
MNIKFSLIALLLPVVSASTFAADTACNIKQYEMGLRYQQQSAEIMALQLQTYKFAQQQLNENLTRIETKKKKAIIIDLDETVLDNTPLLVKDLNKCHDYTQWDTWGDWEKNGKPNLIPGAKDFLNFVDKQHIAIFYVSDRSQENKQSTIKTLASLHLPQVNNNHILLANKSKQLRREDINQHYQVIMLLGDSLADFAAEFKTKKPTAEQRQLVEQHQQMFGTQWIIMPNSSYGSWSQSQLKS